MNRKARNTGVDVRSDSLEKTEAERLNGKENKLL